MAIQSKYISEEQISILKAKLSKSLEKSLKIRKRYDLISGTLTWTVFLFMVSSICLAMLAVMLGQAGIVQLIGQSPPTEVAQMHQNWKIICGFIAILEVIAVGVDIVINRLGFKEQAFKFSTLHGKLQYLHESLNIFKYEPKSIQERYLSLVQQFPQIACYSVKTGQYE